MVIFDKITKVDESKWEVTISEVNSLYTDNKVTKNYYVDTEYYDDAKEIAYRLHKIQRIVDNKDKNVNYLSDLTNSINNLYSYTQLLKRQVVLDVINDILSKTYDSSLTEKINHDKCDSCDNAMKKLNDVHNNVIAKLNVLHDEIQNTN